MRCFGKRGLGGGGGRREISCSGFLYDFSSVNLERNPYFRFSAYFRRWGGYRMLVEIWELGIFVLIVKTKCCAVLKYSLNI